MKPKMIKYCKSIDLTGPFLKRIEEIYEMVIEVIKEEPDKVIIEDYINEDGARTYTDLSFLSASYLVSIAQFLTNDTIILNDVKDKIESITISKQDYDFKKATEKSRLNLKILYLHPGIIGNYTASKENCDFLWKHARDYFFPLLIK